MPLMPRVLQHADICAEEPTLMMCQCGPDPIDLMRDAIGIVIILFREHLELTRESK